MGCFGETSGSLKVRNTRKGRAGIKALLAAVNFGEDPGRLRAPSQHTCLVRKAHMLCEVERDEEPIPRKRRYPCVEAGCTRTQVVAEWLVKHEGYQPRCPDHELFGADRRDLDENYRMSRDNFYAARNQGRAA